MPCHHNLEEYLTGYLDGAGLRGDPKGALFRTIGRGTGKLTRTVLPQANAYAMIGRRAAAAGIATKLDNRTFRAPRDHRLSQKRWHPRWTSRVPSSARSSIAFRPRSSRPRADCHSHPFLRSFARVTAALKMRVEDLRPRGAGWMVRLHEKGGKEHVIAMSPRPRQSAARLYRRRRHR